MNITKTFKIKKQTVSGGATADVATLPLAFGQSARLRIQLRGSAADKSFYGETVAFVRNGAGAVAFADSTKPTSGGTGYSTDTGVSTTVTKADGSAASGAGLTVDTTVSGGVVTALTVNAAGDRYQPGDIITVDGGTGATYQLQAADVITIAVVGNAEVVKMDDAAGTPAIAAAAPATATDKKVRLRATAATGDTVVEGSFDVDYFANTPV